MTIRKYKPTTPGRRHASVNMHVEVTKKTPEKSLLAPLNKCGGRNHQGKITVQGRGGGHKRRYRKIDFKRRKDDMPATIIRHRVRPQPIVPHRPAEVCRWIGTLRYIPAPKCRDRR